ncbi:MAG: HAD family hydrolase [Deltaproteobacteria bacterium]|nr:HAD family hydrolase [Deltaproteobacteria bacterium]
MEEKSIKGVIFDLDGTLIDSYEAIYLSFQFAYQNMGLQPLPFDEVKRVVGYGLRNTFRDLLGEERVPEALRLFRQKYEDLYRQNTSLLPGAREVSKALHERGIKLAVATNKLGRFSREIFQHFGMDKLFAVIVGDEDVSHNKPHPEMLLYAIEKMGLPNEEVIFVGDSLIDIQTGKNAGVRVFVVPTGVARREELEKAQPAVIMDRLTDLLKYL